MTNTVGGNSENEYDTQQWLQQTEGQSNVVDGVSVNSAEGQKKFQTLTGSAKTQFQQDMMEAVSKGKSMLLTLTLPSGGGAPGTPILSHTGEINTDAVTAFANANPWFSSGFLVALTMNMSELVQNQNKAQQMEAMNIISQMNSTVALAQTLGDLIMSKAEMQQAQYMGMAIASLATLAVAVVGAGLSIKGGLKKGAADSLTEGLEDMKLSGTQEKDTTFSEQTAMKVGAKPDVATTEAQPTSQPSETSTAETTVDKKKQIIEQEQKKEDQQFVKQQQAEQTQLTEEPEENTAGMSGEGSEEEVQGGQSQEALADGGTISESHAKADAKTQPQVEPDKGSATTAEGTPAGGTTEKQRMRAERDAAHQEATYYSSLGSLLLNANQSLNSAATNFIQMAYAMPIADNERMQEMVRASQKIAQTGLDLASQGFNTAGQNIDSALQMLQKVQDDLRQAFKIGG